MIGEMVRKYRIEKGFSLSELAEHTGIDKSYLLSIERKIHLTPTIEVLEKITSALDVSMDTLISECSSEATDPVWDDLVIDALEAGMSTEDYIQFIQFVKKLNPESTPLQKSSAYYFERFDEKIS
ncbi:helix-turn-helix domain-containing protein [Halalkalibacter alkalisediminis]|uniref:Helix-turn-helix domain-containing protein n=1 Tax=Halalkalibacter alkalisediminis TaxID=935616 RepID=A0ABV6NJN2_9BACI|nr:helix-turn-helix transcriptional regulator [Halalkalibacter alkalisediminis]